MEAQDKIMRKFSKFESPFALAMKHSAIDKYENLSAAQALRKASMTLGESDVMKVLNRKSLLLDSQVTIAIKQAQIPQLNQAFTAVDTLSLAIKKIPQQREWQQKMDAALSPITEQSAAFKLFHEQTTKIAQIFDPSVSAYLRKNVRTEFYNVNSINVLEAIYLKSFETLSYEVTDSISKKIASTPKLIEIIRNLGVEFYNSYLSNSFIDELATVIAEKLGLKKSEVIVVSSLITFYLFILKPEIDSYMQTKTDERQDMQIGSNSNNNTSQDKKINNLEFINQQKDAIKISKEALHNSLNDAIPDFESELMSKFGKRTVKRYTLVAASFVDYLNEHKESSRFDEITKDDIDNFVMDAQYVVLRNFDKVEIMNKLDAFLTHLDYTDTREKEVSN